MKRIYLVLLAALLLPSLSYAGIPISEKTIVPVKKEVNSKQPKLKKEKKKNSFFKKITKKLRRDGETSKKSLFNWLSFGTGLAAFLAIIAGSIFVAVPMGIAAIVLGIIGLKKKQRMRGLGIAGIILGGVFFALVLLLVVILAVWLSNG